MAIYRTTTEEGITLICPAGFLGRLMWHHGVCADMILNGGPGDETLYGYGHGGGTGLGVYVYGNNILNGGDGNDILYGRQEAIEVSSIDGVIYGHVSGDTLNGGDGNDTLRGGSVLNGGAGDDLLEASRGGVILIGGPGADRFFVRPSCVIRDFDLHGGDRIDLSGYRLAPTWTELQAAMSGSTIDTSALHRYGGTITLSGINTSDLTPAHFIGLAAELNLIRLHHHRRLTRSLRHHHRNRSLNHHRSRRLRPSSMTRHHHGLSLTLVHHHRTKASLTRRPWWTILLLCGLSRNRFHHRTKPSLTRRLRQSRRRRRTRTITWSARSAPIGSTARPATITSRAAVG